MKELNHPEKQYIARWGGDEFTVILQKIKNTNDIRTLCKEF